MMKWTLGLLAVGCMLVMAGPADAEEGDGLLLRAMTFNILHGDGSWGSRKEVLFDILEDHAPDVVGLQEALGYQITDILADRTEFSEVRGSNEGGHTNALPHRPVSGGGIGDLLVLPDSRRSRVGASG
jgi:hypothetical protein